MDNITKEEFQKLTAELIEKRNDVETLVKITRGMLNVLGLIDPETGTIADEYLTGEGNIFSPIGKSMADLLSLMGQTKLPGSLGRRAAEKMEAKFEFVKEIVPLVEKYKDQL